MARLYRKVATRGLRRFHRQVASEICSSLTRGRLLDVGTGPGRLLVEIARRSPDLELVGVDISQTMLKMAAEAMRSAQTDPVQLVRADVRDLPFPDGSFEMVVSTLSLHHWRDWKRGVRECFRVTAPGGRCWIYDLRTDVPAKALADLAGGEGLGRAVLGWVFKFHGVKPKDYEAGSVAQWLGRGATVRAEAHAAHLRLNIHKASNDQRNEIPRFACPGGAMVAATCHV